MSQHKAGEILVHRQSFTGPMGTNSPGWRCYAVVVDKSQDSRQEVCQHGDRTQHGLLVVTLAQRRPNGVEQCANEERDGEGQGHVAGGSDAVDGAKFGGTGARSVVSISLTFGCGCYFTFIGCFDCVPQKGYWVFLQCKKFSSKVCLFSVDSHPD